MADDHHQKASTSSNNVATTTISSTDLAVGENPSNEEAKTLKFSGDEETLIIRMYNLVGDRWSLIAGRIPGRSAEEIEKYWNSRHTTNESN
ncbi:Homeodomain-like superfamily protein [Perilla frutescens var. hirtella]|uniref:Homeodomain-like superfamily protein n=1 Tax=Perilla frutescens var. hirtella TaxID=608512 RepID=A0AAD4J5Q6_PERFH|nr:Homeodomain-like superfamily protein [Perilla frutescens var. hirtella]